MSFVRLGGSGLEKQTEYFVGIEFWSFVPELKATNTFGLSCFFNQACNVATFIKRVFMAAFWSTRNVNKQNYDIK